jgi:hypothetical protein
MQDNDSSFSFSSLFALITVCIQRSFQLTDNEAHASVRQAVFGANTLKDLFVVLAMHTSQVGLAQKQPKAAGTPPKVMFHLVLTKHAFNSLGRLSFEFSLPLLQHRRFSACPRTSASDTKTRGSR